MAVLVGQVKGREIVNVQIRDLHLLDKNADVAKLG